MPPSQILRDYQSGGIERLGACLSHIRKRPGMYFLGPPYLQSFSSFLLGYELAESCHDIPEKHFEADGFSAWLHTEKGLKPNPNYGWMGMIEMIESDPVNQLELTIDYFAEYVGIQLSLEEPARNQEAEQK